MEIIYDIYGVEESKGKIQEKVEDCWENPGSKFSGSSFGERWPSLFSAVRLSLDWWSYADCGG